MNSSHHLVQEALLTHALGEVKHKYKSKYKDKFKYKYRYKMHSIRATTSCKKWSKHMPWARSNTNKSENTKTN